MLLSLLSLLVFEVTMAMAMATATMRMRKKILQVLVLAEYTY